MKRLLILALAALVAGLAGCGEDKKTPDKPDGELPVGEEPGDEALSYALGARCDEDKFVEICDGNKAIYCDEGVVAAYDCKSDACVRFESVNFANCALSSLECATPGAKTKACDKDEGYTDLYDMECHVASDGKHYLVDMDMLPCASECTSDTSCDVQKCSEATYEELCAGDVAFYCSDGYVVRRDCEVEGLSCLLDDGIAGCE
ncbi:MAG: hypothetical protein FWC40_04975 [Proteobacteria bacterium]|nr:hypothetical protein [Pseudomonadota bacterium]